MHRRDENQVLIEELLQARDAARLAPRAYRVEVAGAPLAPLQLEVGEQHE